MTTTRSYVAPLLSAALVSLLAASRVSAEPLYTVSDRGLRSDSPGGLPPALDINRQARLKFTDSDNLDPDPGAGWAMPSTYAGALPDGIANGPMGRRAAAEARAGDNIAGYGNDMTLHWAGFADIGGNATMVGRLPGADFSLALGVNQAGQVVGMSGGRAFLYTQADGIKALGGNLTSAAYAINDSGQIVGEIARPGDRGQLSVHAFTSFDDGRFVDLNRLIDPSGGWTLTRAMDINAAGQIATFGLDAQGRMHALVLTPNQAIDAAKIVAAAADASGDPAPPWLVPEPSTLAFFGLAAAGLAVRGVRSRRAARRPR